jgi:hypothetical protein
MAVLRIWDIYPRSNKQKNRWGKPIFLSQLFMYRKLKKKNNNFFLTGKENFLPIDKEYKYFLPKNLIRY